MRGDGAVAGVSRALWEITLLRIALRGLTYAAVAGGGYLLLRGRLRPPAMLAVLLGLLLATELAVRVVPDRWSPSYLLLEEPLRRRIERKLGGGG